MTVSGEQSVMMDLTTVMLLSPATVSVTGQQIIGSVDCIKTYLRFYITPSKTSCLLTCTIQNFIGKRSYSQQDNVRTNTESVQCHHVFDTAYVALALRGHVTSSIT